MAVVLPAVLVVLDKLSCRAWHLFVLLLLLLLFFGGIVLPDLHLGVIVAAYRTYVAAVFSS